MFNACMCSFIILLAIIPITSICAPGEPHTTTIDTMLHDNWENIRTIDPQMAYNTTYRCGEISNEYIKNNPEWRILEIANIDVGLSHAVNFKCINGDLIINDDYWELTYQLNNYSELPIHIYEYGEYIPIGNHTFSINVKNFTCADYS